MRSPRRWTAAAAAALAMVGVVAPVGPDSLPEPLEALAPATPAEAAEGTVVAGTPDVCSAVDPDPDDSSTTWTADTTAEEEVCVLTADAVCPTGYHKPTGSGVPPYLCYPNSCSAAFDVDDLINYWIPQPGTNLSGANACRVYALTECRVGIGPTHDGLCRYVQRRSWTCAAGYNQHNRFNTCYQVHTPSPPGTPPPCDTSTGAPDFPLLSCDDYAGDDYDDDEDCDTDISSHLTDRSGGAAAAYWCEFDASDLDVDCHRAVTPSGADCRTSIGVCLKRASTTRGQQLRALGGCSAIARNIGCAVHQADYADKIGTGVDLEALADTIRADGCEPCRVKPFRPLTASECPDSALTGSAPVEIDLDNTQQRLNAGLSRSQVGAVRIKGDVDGAGNALGGNGSGCQELPPGRLTWSTPSFTSLAMVNTRVRLDVQWDFSSLSWTPALGTNRGLYVCLLEPRNGRNHFYLTVAVEPLWPAGDPDDSTDTGDRNLIEQLFGSGSLEWWDALDSAEQSERTTAFFATSGGGAVDVPCSLQAPIWCIWKPKRAGYYSLTATGSLSVSIITGVFKNTAYTGTVTNDWYSQLSKETLRQCRNNGWPATCPFQHSGTWSAGIYIDNEPIGIQVNEVRVVTRNPARR